MAVETRPYVSWEQMNAFMTDVFAAYGVPRDEAAICADVLLEADRRGIESHGCNRFKPIYIDRIKNGTLLPVTDLEIVKETPTTLVMDAHDGMGMVASYRMMEKLIEKAKTYGMAGGLSRGRGEGLQCVRYTGRLSGCGTGISDERLQAGLACISFFTAFIFSGYDLFIYVPERESGRIFCLNGELYIINKKTWKQTHGLFISKYCGPDCPPCNSGAAPA